MCECGSVIASFGDFFDQSDEAFSIIKGGVEFIDQPMTFNISRANVLQELASFTTLLGYQLKDQVYSYFKRRGASQ
jgi:hypothetical protein